MPCSCFAYIPVPVLVVFLVSLTNAEINCTTLIISSSCPQLGENCTTLQEGLQEVASWDPVSPPHDCVDLNLVPGEHVLSSPVAISGIVIRFQLRGSEESSTSIMCTHIAMDYSIHLDGFIEVRLENVSIYHCNGPIRIIESDTVFIFGSLFSSFSGGALDVQNCSKLHIVGSNFVNNKVSAKSDSPSLGNGGGITVTAIGNDSNVTVVIQMCNFAGNRVEENGPEIVSPSELFKHKMLVGTGGGMRLNISEGLMTNITVEDCHFKQNYALSYGGGLYIFFWQALVYTVIVRRTTFINNEAGNGGAGLNIGYSPRGEEIPNASITITDSAFDNNRAKFGGGAYVFPLVGYKFGVAFKNCTFTRNSAEFYGAAIGLLWSDILYFAAFNHFEPYIIDNCTFYNNTGSRAGIVDIAHSPLLMRGYNIFRNNTGPTLRVIGSKVTVEGKLNFIGNNAENCDGGALYITSYGQVVMQNNSQMSFIGNRGSMGSAIVVESRNIVNGLTSSTLNNLCFLQDGHVLDEERAAPTWNGVSINFSQNAAIVGPAVYINQLDLCSWDQAHPSSRIHALKWSFMNFGSDNINSGHPESRRNDPSLFIQTPPFNLSVTNINLTAPPGQPVKIAVQMFDELHNPTSATVRVTANQQHSTTEMTSYFFQPNLLTFQPSTEYQTTRYLVSKKDNLALDSFDLKLSTYSIYSDYQNPIARYVNFTANVCPPGYSFKSDTRQELEKRQVYLCLCDTIDNPLLIQCESDGQTFVLAPNIWSAVYTEDSVGTLSAEGYRCPPGYCGLVHNTSLGERTHGSLFNLSQPDLQCSCNRSGILCGNCRKGFGVSVLLNRCITCSSVYALLVVVLVIIDILVCIGIVLYSKPLPVWVYPCLFYIQVLPYVTSHFPVTFSTVHKHLYYISSAIALYFPYDFCLCRVMNPLVSYLLRYLPLVTVVPTAMVTLVIKHKKFQPTRWYGIWTLTMFMYTQIVHTSMSILNCPVIIKSGMRWYLNGDIECFTGSHLPLAFVAIFILLIALFLVPLTALITRRKLTEKIKWIKYLIFPLSYAFKSELECWGASMELSRRFLLLLFTLAFPFSSHLASAFVIMVLMTIYLFIQPYKSVLANILETVLSLSTLILLFIVSDVAITERLLQISSSKQLHSSVTQSKSCHDQVRGVTNLTILLSLLYYLPFIILTTGIMLATLNHIWNAVKHVWQKESIDEQHMMSSYDSTDETRRSADYSSFSVYITNTTAE